jgi:hypothetical protein
VVGRAGGGLFGHVVAEPQHQLLLSLAALLLILFGAHFVCIIL